MRKKAKTAEDLIAELEADPAWVEQRASRRERAERRETEAAVDEAELVRELRAAGYDLDSVYDLVNSTPHAFLTRRFVGAYPNAYPILLRHLRLPHAAVIREGIVRALSVSDVGEDVVNELLNQFRTEQDREVRWAIANALKTAMPYPQRLKHPEIQKVFEAGRGG